MKVHASATAEIVDTATGSPGRSFQSPWLPMKLESCRAPGIVRSGTSIPPHRIIPLDEKQDRNGELQDVFFLGGILSFYGKIPDGSIVLDRARIKGMNIDTWV